VERLGLAVHLQALRIAGPTVNTKTKINLDHRYSVFESLAFVGAIGATMLVLKDATLKI